jgi:DNA-binding NarL/FixJ family response regulator
VVASDEPLEGRAIGALLEKSNSVSATYAQPDQLAATIRAGQRGAIVWLVEHVDADCLKRVQIVRDMAERPKLCLLARSVEPQALRELLLEKGSRGLTVMLRGSTLEPGDLFRTLVQLFADRVTLSPAILEQLIVQSELGGRDRVGRLTPPELSVLELIAMGYRNREIARRLDRSEKLVEKQVGRIFTKLGLERSHSETLDRRVSAALIYLARSVDTAIAQPVNGGAPAG